MDRRQANARYRLGVILMLKFHNVCKTYTTSFGTVPVLYEVNITIEKGELCALTGPSGSGKTTVMNLAGLLDKPDAGRVPDRAARHGYRGHGRGSAAAGLPGGGGDRRRPHGLRRHPGGFRHRRAGLPAWTAGVR